MQVLIDTNVLIDYIQKREPFYLSAEKIFNACAENRIKGCIAAHSVSNLFFILRKQFTVEERKGLLKMLCTIFEVVGINKETIMAALDDNGFDDIEDCIQEKCALTVHADYIVSRNIKDFMNSQVRSLDPDTFVCSVLREV